METKTNNLKSKSYSFSIDLLSFVGGLNPTITNKIIINQLVRSGTSMGANIVEAQGFASRREFINFFHIALKSAYETKYWLYLLLECEKDKKLQIDNFIKECEEIAKMLSSSIMTLKGKK